MASAIKYVNEEVDDEDSMPLKGNVESAARQSVRRIQQHPVLSSEWIEVLDELKRLVRLVQLEGRMPINVRISEAHGRNADSAGTLWDQEQSETAIRVLVEEAKVTLCLRIMYEFKLWMQRPDRQLVVQEAAQQQPQYAESQLEAKLSQFEEYLGFLLDRAFAHVETLQLTDIPLLIEHVHLVLARFVRVERPLPQLKMQESVVLLYFASLMRHAEALNNGEVLAKANDVRLVHLVVEQLLRVGDHFPLEIIRLVAQGFAALCDNEDFRSDWKSWFVGEDGQAPSAPVINRFLELEEKMAGRVLEDNPDSKRDLRPLLDFFNVLKRSV